MVLIELIKEFKKLDLHPVIDTTTNQDTEVLMIKLYKYYNDFEPIFRGNYIGQPNECLECLLDRILKQITKKHYLI